ncbi:MAG TPA: hypothetical protein VG188_07560 [Solirubrobacteraceae bacterium]|jgi:hypothetical protein|nr:hypothetical protein [Solirubrobacteraceae bacterium]
MASELPDGLSFERNRDYEGRIRRHSPWIRRALLCAVTAIPVLALLDVFGQHPSTTSASSPAASLSVTAPTRLRGGLMFQALVKVRPRREVHHLQLVFDEGWWESIQVNSIKPEPESETSRNGKIVLEYGSWPAGKELVCWVNFQVNPTNVGDRREDVSLEDAGETLATVHRSLTIFP